MKKFFALVAFMFVAVATHAQEYNLYIQTSSAETGYALADLQKLTFVDGKINVTKKDGSVAQTLPLTDISKMYFSTTPVAIKDVEDEQVIAEQGVYDLTGRKISSADMKQLPKGIYIVNGKKVQVK